MTDQQHRSPRYRVHGLSVVYDTNEGFWTGPVLDASCTGIFIETTHELPVGTQVTIMPQGADDERLPFEVEGVVVRVNQLDWDNYHNRTPGIALKLVGLSEVQATQLQSFLEQHGEPR